MSLLIYHETISQLYRLTIFEKKYIVFLERTTNVPAGT